ncbi:polyprotein, partial [Operophtera brumata]
MLRLRPAEYLPTLAPRGDVRRKQNNIKPGEIVIIADGSLPRNVWPKGQIERVYPGPDGVVRSAEVRTRGGIFRRPTRRLI